MVLICDRVAFGPRCTDGVLETTPIEESDCLTRALYACASRVEGCKGPRFLRRHSLERPNNDIATQGCANEAMCYNMDCLFLIKACYCLGSEGQVCVNCNTTPPITGGVSQVEQPTPPAPPPKETVISSHAYNIGLTNTAYGEIIPIIYGNVYVGGNIIWCSEPYFEDVSVKDPVVSTTTVTTAFVDLEIGIAAAELSGITRMWFDDQLVLDLTGTSPVPILKKYADLGMTVTLFAGDESQKVEQKTFPFGKVPAYRGLSYVAIDHYPVVAAGGKIPTIRVEVASAITNNQIVVDTSSLGYALDAQPITADPVSGRVFAFHGNDIKIVDGASLTEVATIATTNPIAALHVTPDEANIILQDTAHSLQFIAGGERDDISTIASTNTFEHIAALNVTSPTSSALTVIFAAYANKLRQYERNSEDGTLTFVRELVDTSFDTYNSIIFNQFQALDDDSSNKSIYAFSNAVNGVVKIKSQMVDQTAVGIYYNSSLGFRTTILNLETFTNDDNPTLETVIYDKDTGNMILFVSGSTGNRAICLRYFDLTSVWNVELDDVPGSVSDHAMRAGGGRNYFFIGSAGGVYRLNLDTGASTFVGEIGEDFMAPAFQSGQYFDGVSRVISYIDENGDISKLFPDRKVSDDPSLATIFADVFSRALLEPSDYDVSSLDQLFVHGYIVQNQETAQKVVEELQTFFNLTVSDAGGRILVNTLDNGATFIVDDPTMVANIDRQRLITDTSDLYKVTVEYFDTAQDGNLFQQYVTRDLFRPEDDISLTNLQEDVYSVNVFTDSTTARRSAELYMMRQFQRKSALSLLLGPRALAVEPTDIIDFLGFKIRCKTVELDVTFQANASGETEDTSIYGETPQLLGVNYDFDEELLVNQDVTIKNYPVIFNLPLVREDNIIEGVYIGQLNPDNTPVSEITPMYVRGPTSVAVETAPVTKPVVLAHLTQLPTWNTAPFTLDRSSAIKMVFNSDIPDGLLSPCQTEDLYESTQRNLLFVGNELIQYRDVTISGREATFTNLLRGRFGTDTKMKSHILGERCVAFSTESLVIQDAPQDAISLNEITGMLFNEGSTAGARTKTIHFDDVQSTAWQPQNIRIFKNNEIFFQGVSAIAYSRENQRSGFYNTDNIDEADQQELPAGSSNGEVGIYAVASSTWDPEEFKAMFVTQDFSYAPISEFNALGTFFDGSALDAAGIAWLDDLILVAAIVANDQLVSEPNAFFFDAQVNYFTNNLYVPGIQLFGA